MPPGHNLTEKTYPSADYDHKVASRSYSDADLAARAEQIAAFDGLLEQIVQVAFDDLLEQTVQVSFHNILKQTVQNDAHAANNSSSVSQPIGIICEICNWHHGWFKYRDDCNSWEYFNGTWHFQCWYCRYAPVSCCWKWFGWKDYSAHAPNCTSSVSQSTEH